MTVHAIKKFNTVGPCHPSEHYMLPVLPRLPDVEEMIEGGYYFIIHAPRKSGKTTFLQTLTDEINAGGRMYALDCSLELLDGVDDIDRAMGSVVSQVLYSMELSNVKPLADFASAYKPMPEPKYDTAVMGLLNDLSVSLDKALVIFFDETDCLSAGPLIPFLRQIRLGHNNRYDSPQSKFPRSLALVGMRDIRGYLAQARPDSEPRVLSSPLSIIKGSFTLANFTEAEIGDLYRQHTEATGQIFEPSAVGRAWWWTEGQPWLVNVLADQTVVRDLGGDHSIPVTGWHVDRAAEALIRGRDHRIISPLKRLKEPRVRRVMEPVIIGEEFLPDDVREEDKKYALDLGLLKEVDELLAPANPIYREAIIRTLAYPFEKRFSQQLALAKARRWIDGDRLDMTSLLKAFQEYWREHSGTLNDPNGYSEAAALLALNAYLHKILNGGVERLRREYALGKLRLDLLAKYKGVSYPIELRIKANQKPLADSLKRLRARMDIRHAAEGWLMIFDDDNDKRWEEKIYWDTKQFEGATMHVAGC